MKKKVKILLHGLILAFILALSTGTLAVYAENEETGPHINYKTATVNIGDDSGKLQLQIGGDKKPRWISYNVNVARVAQDGTVTALRKGTAIISSGIGFPREICVVKVVDPSVKLNKSAAILYSANSNSDENTL